MGLLYMRPDEMLTAGTVSTSVGVTDASYDDDWLIDRRPGRPAMASSGSVAWAVTAAASLSVNCAVAANHSVEPGRMIAFTGGVACSLVGPALQTNSITLNAWNSLTPAVAGTFTVTVTSNPSRVAIGEAFCGTLRDLGRHLQQQSAAFDVFPVAVRAPSVFGSVPDVDQGIIARRLAGTIRANSEVAHNVRQWFDSTCGGTRPTVIIPDPTLNDAWVVKFLQLRATPISYRHWALDLLFEEFPRMRY